MVSSEIDGWTTQNPIRLKIDYLVSVVPLKNHLESSRIEHSACAHIRNRSLATSVCVFLPLSLSLHPPGSPSNNKYE